MPNELRYILMLSEEASGIEGFLKIQKHNAIEQSPIYVKTLIRKIEKGGYC